MKKFIVFGMNHYHPYGGLEDIKGSFDNLEDATKLLTEDGSDYGYIVDHDTWKKISQEGRQ